VAQSQRKILPNHEAQIWEWRKPGPGRKTLREIADLLGKGSEDWPAIDVTHQTVQVTYKAMELDKGELFGDSKWKNKPPPERLDRLVHRLIGAAERETRRIEVAAQRGRLDAKKLSGLSKAVRDLYDLHERSQREKDEPTPSRPTEKPSSFVDGLTQSVPQDPPSQDTGSTNQGQTEQGDGMGESEPSRRPEVGSGPEAAPRNEVGSTNGSTGSAASAVPRIVDGGLNGATDFAAHVPPPAIGQV
jgi:hypothetical protein